MASFLTADYFKARMRHWLVDPSQVPDHTISMEREPSPNADGSVEGQKTWYDYAGKTNNAYNTGTQVQPLFVARVLPDGTSQFTYMPRNSLGFATNEISTYSFGSGTTRLLRTNVYVYDPTPIKPARSRDKSSARENFFSLSFFSTRTPSSFLLAARRTLRLNTHTDSIGPGRVLPYSPNLA
jgi:hypothetical protein